MNIIGLVLLGLTFGCANSDDLQTNCYESAEIISHAKELLTVSKAENVVKNAKIVSTIITSDNTISRKYLRSRADELKTLYEKIRLVYEKQGDDSIDALCALAVLNEFTFILSGNALEDRCKYIRLLIRIKDQKVSNWILDEFFARLITNRHYTSNEWNKMNHKDKFDLMLETLLVPDERGQTCLTEE